MTTYTPADYRRARRVVDALLADLREPFPDYPESLPGMNVCERYQWRATRTHDPLALGWLRVRLIRYLTHLIAGGWWPR